MLFFVKARHIQSIALLVFLSLIINESHQSHLNDLKKCKTFADYITKNEFNEGELLAFMKKQKQPWRHKIPFKNSVPKDSVQSYYKKYSKCSLHLDSYNKLNGAVRKKGALTCDWISPRLDFADARPCKSLGEYYLQFGVSHYVGFNRTLKSARPKSAGQMLREEKKRKRKQDMANGGARNERPGKMSASARKAWDKITAAIEKMKKSRANAPVLKLSLNAYYKFNCDAVVSDYVAFAKYINGLSSVPKTGQICEYFVRPKE